MTSVRPDAASARQSGSAPSSAACAGDERDAVRDAAMRDRDADRRRRREPRRDAGHDLTLDAGLAQREHLLAAAAEHERIAALEPHDEVPRARFADHELLDERLRRRARSRRACRRRSRAHRHERNRGSPARTRSSCSTTSAVASARTAFSVRSSGSPGPAPTRSDASPPSCRQPVRACAAIDLPHFRHARSASGAAAQLVLHARASACAGSHCARARRDRVLGDAVAAAHDARARRHRARRAGRAAPSAQCAARSRRRRPRAIRATRLRPSHRPTGAPRRARPPTMRKRRPSAALAVVVAQHVVAHRGRGRRRSRQRLPPTRRSHAPRAAPRRRARRPATRRSRSRTSRACSRNAWRRATRSSPRAKRAHRRQGSSAFAMRTAACLSSGWREIGAKGLRRDRVDAGAVAAGERGARPNASGGNALPGRPASDDGDRHDDAAAPRFHAHEVAFREAATRRIRGMKLDRGLARVREQRGHRAGARHRVPLVAQAAGVETERIARVDALRDRRVLGRMKARAAVRTSRSGSRCKAARSLRSRSRGTATAAARRRRASRATAP